MSNNPSNNSHIGAYAAILLIITALALSSCDKAGKAPVVPEWDRNHQELNITVNMYDSRTKMQAAIEERLKTKIDSNTLGKAVMSPNDNICEVFIIKPTRIDDIHTLTLGHEVLHCVYGRYHKEH